MITMRQIAKEAGLSVATVSRAFNEPEKLREETCAHILAVKKKLEQQKDLASQKDTASQMIGILVSHNANPFFYEVVRNLDLRMRTANYTQLTIFTGNGFTTSRADIEKLCSVNIRALVLIPPLQAEGVTGEWLSSLNIPVIQVFNSLYPEFDSIAVNDEKGGYLAARNLLLAGHRNILYIGVKGQHWQGFLRAHGEMNVPVQEENAMFLQIVRGQSSAICEMIQRVRPTAVFTHTEYATMETIQACAQLGIRIPEDMSLIAYDDYPWMALMGISAVSHPMNGLAESVCQVILERVGQEESKEPVRLVVEPRLITRDSVRMHRD